MLYTAASHLLNVMLEWSEIMGSYNRHCSESNMTRVGHDKETAKH